jgi:protein-S-isoprenylcysteine O-methyltransferase Ste14
MMKFRNPKMKERRKMNLPKKLVPFVWAILVLVILVFLPWIAAQVGYQLGWPLRTLVWWNFMGLIVVAIGLGLYVGSLVFHYRSYQAAVRLSFSPPHLVVAGPYQLSRNPMYIAGLLAWFGWTIFYGSPAVLVVMVLLWIVFNFRVIPHEERQLDALFGEEYLAYKRTVRRWLGRH